MPVRCLRGNPRFRVRTLKSGKKVRLAFCGRKVVEAKRVNRRKR